MNVSLKNLLSDYKFIPVYLERKNITKDALGPCSVEFHWTSLCNNKCIHCSYGVRRQKKSSLSDKVINDVISDLSGLKTKAVYISGGGEPTLIKEWLRYAEKIMDNNICLAMLTNGTNISKMDLNIVRKFNYIAISVYSNDEAEYKQITGSKFFSKQFDLPARIKNEKNSAIVGARCVINKINYKSIIVIYEKAMKSGYDYIVFIPAIDYESRGVGLSRGETDAVRKIIEKNYYKLDFTKTNLDVVLDRGVTHYDVKDYRRDFLIPPRICCAADIRSNAFVNYDGGVYLCQPHIGKIEYCIGNVNERRFKDIWNSKKHGQVIQRLNKTFSAGLCKNCRSIGFNKKADEYDNSGSSIFTITKDSFV